MKNLCIPLFTLFTMMCHAQVSYTFTIDVEQVNHEISPYIYGVAYKSYPYAKAKSLNGSRMTSFNWETNVSNSGTYIDDETNAFQSDFYIPAIVGVTEENWSEPGKTLRTFQEKCETNNQFSIISLPMAGYVAIDTNCYDVAIAPSACWEESKNDREGPSIFPPDLTDGVVYNEECLQFLVDNFGMNGVDAYFLDNEPGLWHEDYPYIVGLDTTNNIGNNNLSYRTLVQKSISLASTIKRINPTAEVFGPALSGFNAFDNLIQADSFSYTFFPFAEYYLKEMKVAEEETGVKLLDVFDLHWYSFGSGVLGMNGNEDGLWEEAIEARLDAPRSLWDSDFVEEGAGVAEPLKMLKKMQSNIDEHYPGVKLAVSEYYFGAWDHISGGLAQADVLGVFGKENVYFASLWPDWGNFEDELDGFARTGFDLYLNYDGNGGEFGSQSVQASTENVKYSSVYASIDTILQDLHIITINKSQNDAAIANFNITNFVGQEQVEVYYFDENNLQIQQQTNTTLNELQNFEMQPMTAYHFVIKKEPNALVDRIINPSVFSFLPNPIGKQGFRLKNDSNHKVDKIEFVDLNGKVIFTYDSPLPNELIHFDNLASGLYFGRIYSSNQVITKSIVIFDEW